MLPNKGCQGKTGEQHVSAVLHTKILLLQVCNSQWPTEVTSGCQGDMFRHFCVSTLSLLIVKRHSMMISKFVSYRLQLQTTIVQFILSKYLIYTVLILERPTLPNGKLCNIISLSFVMKHKFSFQMSPARQFLLPQKCNFIKDYEFWAGAYIRTVFSPRINIFLGKKWTYEKHFF